MEVEAPTSTVVGMPASDPRSILADDLLEVLNQRASRHDAENSFPTDDLDALREIGYLRLLVPRDFGGTGASLEQAVRCQARLASAAPATALAVNMHHVAVGIARARHESGDDGLDWMLREVVAGETYALAISEIGNDAVLYDSNVRADPQADGAYLLHGMKIFTSLSPVWTRLVTFGRDDSRDEPALVHGVLRRDDDGVRIHDDWDTLGMRATQSCSTSLDGARIPADRVIARLPVGPNSEPHIFAVHSNFLLLVAACYVGIGDRALELAIDAAKHRTSSAQGGIRLADDVQVREEIARMSIRQLAARTLVESIARDVDEGAPHGDAWFARLTMAKLEAVAAAAATTHDALGIVGGSGYRSGHELARLLRDVLAGGLHPSHERAVRRLHASHRLGPIQDPPSRL